jgi:hypothetical protein
MRNPLSALIGCADEITSCLSAYRAGVRKREEAPGTDNFHKNNQGVLALDFLLVEGTCDTKQCASTSTVVKVVWLINGQPWKPQTL